MLEMNFAIRALILLGFFLCLTLLLSYDLLRGYEIDIVKFVNTLPGKPTLFCIILTSNSSLSTKATAIYESWAHKCDNYKFVTTIPNYILKKNNIKINETILEKDGIELTHHFNLLQPPGLILDVYDKLTRKVYLTLRYIFRNYDYYDWYLKTDDDTFIFVDNLRKFIQDKDSTEPVTYGYDFKVIVNQGYHSGGGGYLLSNKALHKIGARLNKGLNGCPNSGVEDVDVAKCLRRLNVFPKKSIDEDGKERFHPLSISDHYTGNFPDWMFTYASNPVKNGSECCSDSSISFHYLSESEMYKLSQTLKKFEKSNSAYTFDMIYKTMSNK